MEGEIPPPDAHQGFLPCALWWLDAGFTVFPLYPPDEPPRNEDDIPAKRPNGRLLGDGNTHETIGTRDKGQVRMWWREEPASGVAVATRPSGVVVVDIDPRAGGWEKFLQICDEHDVDLSEVPRSQSASQDGGVHLYWRIPFGHTCPVNALVTGVDRPWQVPVPPSSRMVRVGEDRSGNPLFDWRNYEWLAGDPRELPEAPDIVLGPPLRGSRWEPSGSEGFGNTGFDVAGVEGDDILPQTDYGSIDHDRLSDVFIPDGQQSYHLKRIAASMARRYETEDEIANRLLAISGELPRKPHKRPWSRRDFEVMARHATKFVKAQRDKELKAAEALRAQGIERLKQLRGLAGIE